MRIQAQAAVKAATHARKHNTEIEKKHRGESTQLNLIGLYDALCDSAREIK